MVENERTAPSSGGPKEAPKKRRRRIAHSDSGPSPMDDDSPFFDDGELDGERDRQRAAAGSTRTGAGGNLSQLRRYGPYLAAALFFVVFVLGVVFVYQNATMIVNMENLEGTVPLEGRVTDANDTVLEAVSIVVEDADIAVETGADGNFTIEECPRGLQTLRLTKRGYIPFDLKLLLTEKGTYLPIELDRARRNGSAPAVPTVALEGTVRNATGDAVFNATVRLRPGGAETRTNATGHYRIGTVAVGAYNLTVEPAGANGSVAAYRVLVTPNRTRFDPVCLFGINASAPANHTYRDLVPQFTLEGRITTEKGAALPNASIVLVADDDTTYERYADSEGRYLFEQIDAGVYNLSATADGYYVHYRGNYTLDANATADLSLTEGAEFWQNMVAEQQWIICVVVVAIFSTFALLGAVLTAVRKHYSLAVVCGLLGALSSGPFCSINLLLAIGGVLLVFISRNEFR